MISLFEETNSSVTTDKMLSRKKLYILQLTAYILALYLSYIYKAGRKDNKIYNKANLLNKDKRQFILINHVNDTHSLIV